MAWSTDGIWSGGSTSTMGTVLFWDDWETGDYTNHGSGTSWVEGGPNPVVGNVQPHHGSWAFEQNDGDQATIPFTNATYYDVYYAAQIYCDPFAASADWKQDYLQARNGAGNLMAIAGINNPGGAHWHIALWWWDMNAMWWTLYDSLVHCTPSVWHYWVMRFMSDATNDYAWLWVDDVLMANFSNVSVAPFQHLIPNRICIGGQKFAGYSSKDYIDCITVSTGYPHDIF